jgi:hypothetical protein
MSTFRVQTPALAAAAVMIGGTGSAAGTANRAAASAAGQAGAFGGEPITSAFLGMCSRAQQATAELETTVGALSQNVAAAAVGYLVTDRGVVPIKHLMGFKP